MSEKRDQDKDMPKNDASSGQGEGMGQTGGQGPRGGNQSGGMSPGGRQGAGSQSGLGNQGESQGQIQDEAQGVNGDWLKKNEGDGEQGSGGTSTA
ncbi:MAG TPA: hypothetical protein VFH90_01105 [Candidatus Limnocylindria bacterium]|nr:hypothetical protein [Candidatus Limnocylindria bacterium]